jgi:hypothetical protein
MAAEWLKRGLEASDGLWGLKWAILLVQSVRKFPDIPRRPGQTWAQTE